MKIQLVSLLLTAILTFSSVTVFGGAQPAGTGIERAAAPVASFAATNNSFFEVCSVQLGDPNSNLNVRTWEGRVIGKLRHGTAVWVSDYSGEWAKVSVKRGRRWVSVGWVDSNYLLC